MSLELALQEQTAALKENTALLRELSVVVDRLILMSQPAPVEVDRRKNDDLFTVAEKVIETAKNAPVTDMVADTGEAVWNSKPVDLMADVVPVFQKLCVAKGRDAGAGILAKWSVTKLSQVPADKLGELLADIQKAAA
jgi:hypothetical protein